MSMFSELTVSEQHLSRVDGEMWAASLLWNRPVGSDIQWLSDSNLLFSKLC